MSSYVRRDPPTTSVPVSQDSWEDPDLPIRRLLLRFGAGGLSGVVGDQVGWTHHLPVGAERAALEAELQATGLTKLIVDVATGDYIEVGTFEPVEVRRLVAQTMRSSSFRPVNWPPMPDGSFPLVDGWAHPYDSDSGKGHDLFLHGRGSRPMRIFIFPDVVIGPPSRGLMELLSQLQNPNLHTLVVEPTDLSARAAVLECLQFVPEADRPFEGVVKVETAQGSSSHAVYATDAVRHWRDYGYWRYQYSSESDARAKAESEALLAHIAAAAAADVMVTTSPMLLAYPDGIVDRIPLLSPAGALAIVSLYLRQRDSYVIRVPETNHISVAADRSHFLRASTRGLVPSLNRWRAIVENVPPSDYGNLALLGESLEQRLARVLGQRDEMLATLLVKQDTDTAYRAMEHADAVLANLNSAFDITALVAELLTTNGEPKKRMSVSWTRGKWSNRMVERHPELGHVLDDNTKRLLGIIGDLRNTLHSEMLRPSHDQTSNYPRSGVTVAEFHPTDITKFRDEIAALGEYDEWGCEFTDNTVLVDMRRFFAHALPPLFDTLNSLLNWMVQLRISESEIAGDLEFGPWFPAACARLLALGERWSPVASDSMPAPPDPINGLMATGVLGVVDLDGTQTSQKSRVVLSGDFPEGVTPFKDFKVGDFITTLDPVLFVQRLMRVEEIRIQTAGDEATYTVTLRLTDA